MAHRTTILLDDETRSAARELAHRLNRSTSEAIRRAILRYRDQAPGVPPERQRERTEALRRLIELCDGQDADAEIAELKAADEYA